MFKSAKSSHKKSAKHFMNKPFSRLKLTVLTLCYVKFTFNITHTGESDGRHS